MILREDILKVKGKLISKENSIPEKFNGVSINSVEVKKGNIFFAIKGENTDAHKYIPEVIRKKASLIFVNQSWYRTNKDKFKKQSFYIVKDTILALGELASEYKERMNIPLLGIAGSNEKLLPRILSVKSYQTNLMY